MKKRSIGLNSLVYTIKVFVTMFVPMITFPYASRVLGAEGIGKVNFSTSIVNYFVLIAGLGIQTYAIRECSKLRSKKTELEKTVCEIFSINIYSTIISYICFFIFMCTNTYMCRYKDVMLIISLLIVATPLGMEWIYNVFEEYTYITLRTVFVQIISVIFLFLFVKSKNDVVIYAIFTVIGTVGSNLFNFVRVRKYCKIKLVWNKAVLVHMKPIMVLFASAITCTIYLNSDMTMLGIFGTDVNVGYYTSATKVYTMVRNVLFVIITVSIPRFNYYMGNREKEQFERLYSVVLTILIYFLIPISIGLLCVSEEVILLLCGGGFEKAIVPLNILSLALVPTVLGSFFSNIILVPFNKEKLILEATIIGAITNIIANVFILPVCYQVGAALSTLLSEVIVLSIHIINLKKCKKGYFNIRHMGKAFIASIPFFMICSQVRSLIDNRSLSLIVMIGCCIVTYVLLVYILNFNKVNVQYTGKVIKYLRFRR